MRGAARTTSRSRHLSILPVSRKLKRPTPRQRASNPWMPVYMALQPASGTAPRVATSGGGLLPRLFTLAFNSEGGCFLLPCYALTDIYPLGSAALCVARTFLSSLRSSGGTSRQALRAAKVVIIGRIVACLPNNKSDCKANERPRLKPLVQMA